MKRLLLLVTLIINGATFAASSTTADNAQTLRDIAIDNAVEALLFGRLTLDRINPNSNVAGAPVQLFEEIQEKYNSLQEKFDRYKKIIDQYPPLAFILQNEENTRNLENQMIETVHIPGGPNTMLLNRIINLVSILNPLSSELRSNKTLLQLVKKYAIKKHLSELLSDNNSRSLLINDLLNGSINLDNLQLNNEQQLSLRQAIQAQIEYNSAQNQVLE